MKRSIMGLLYLIQGMQSAGVDVQSRLKDIGINAEQFDANALVARTLEWHIQQHLCQGIDPFVGLKVGQHYTLAGYGPFLMFLMTAKDVEQAFAEAMQYQNLTYVFGRLDYVVQAERLALIYQPLQITDDVASFRMISEISGTYRFIRDIYTMTGLPEYPMQAKLPIAKPDQLAQLQAYQTYFGDNVEFGATQAEFWIDAKILKHRLVSHDAIMHEVYRQRCEAELIRMQAIDQNDHQLVEQIQDYLLLQKDRIPSLIEISKALQMPERTLRYQLSLQNTSFQSIREQILKEKAKQLLIDRQYTIEAIAMLLGYAETASFNHAFKRWYAMSPKQYQQQILE